MTKSRFIALISLSCTVLLTACGKPSKEVESTPKTVTGKRCYYYNYGKLSYIGQQCTSTSQCAPAAGPKASVSCK